MSQQFSLGSAERFSSGSLLGPVACQLGRPVSEGWLAAGWGVRDDWATSLTTQQITWGFLTGQGWRGPQGSERSPSAGALPSPPRAPFPVVPLAEQIMWPGLERNEKHRLRAGL